MLKKSTPFFFVIYCWGNGTNTQLYEVTDLWQVESYTSFFHVFFFLMDRGFGTLLHWKSYETKKLAWKLRALSDFIDTSLTSHWLPFKGDTREKEFTSVFLCLCVGLSISPSFHAKPSLKSAIRVHSLLILSVVTMMKTKGILCPKLTFL